MKKKIVLVLLISCVLIISNKENIKTVFEIDRLYEMYYLDFRNTNLNTNNFLEYFNDNIDIVKIEPYVNPLYKDKLNMNYFFDYYSNESNLDKFKDNYLNKLKENNYIDDYNNYKINGIRIDMVKVYTTYDEILNIINKNKDVKCLFTYKEYQAI